MKHPPTMLFLRNVPMPLYEAFKAKCKRMGTSQSQAIHDLMSLWVFGVVAFTPKRFPATPKTMLIKNIPEDLRESYTAKCWDNQLGLSEAMLCLMDWWVIQ